MHPDFYRAHISVYIFAGKSISTNLAVVREGQYIYNILKAIFKVYFSTWLQNYNCYSIKIKCIFLRAREQWRMEENDSNAHW